MNSLQEAMARIMGAPAGGSPQQVSERSADPRWADWGNSRPIGYEQNYTAPPPALESRLGGGPGTSGKLGTSAPVTTTTALPGGGTRTVTHTGAPSTPEQQASMDAALARANTAFGEIYSSRGYTKSPVTGAWVPPGYVEPKRDYYDALMSGKLSTRQGYADFMNKKLAPYGLHSGVNISGPGRGGGTPRVHNASTGWKPRDMSGYKPR